MRARDIVTAAGGAIVATVLTGTVAWAAIPGDGGTIQGCYLKIGGGLRVIDPDRGQRCLPNLEVPIGWNQAGGQGPTGPPGPAGSDGAAGASPSVAPLQVGDANCPSGGAAITDAAGATAYVCSGADGADGTDGDPFSGAFTSPSGEYSLSVTDSGITLSRAGGGSITLSGSAISVESSGALNATAGTALSLVSGSGTGLTSGGDMTASVARDLVATVGRNVAATIGADLTADVASDTRMQSGGSGSFQTGAGAVFQSGAGLSLSGSTVSVNGGSSCLPAARVGDSVNLGTGSILTGSTTVCTG